MKQLISVIVAALFAAASINAVAQDKKADGADKKAQKTEKAKSAPKKTAKKAASKKAEPK